MNLQTFIDVNNIEAVVPTGDPRRWTFIEWTTCDECGDRVSASNGSTTLILEEDWTAAEFAACGLQILDQEPDEIGWCDATGTATCAACHVDE